MAFRSSITTSDFRKLRADQQTYLDKTESHARLLTAPHEVTLFPRPRRFGKTLWMSTLQAFVERRPGACPEADAEERAALFSGLAIWGDEGARAHAGRHPVVSLTFKDVRYRAWSACLEAVAGVLQEAFIRHHDAVRPALGAADAELFDAVYHRRAGAVGLSESLRFLCRVLGERYGERVVVLIDEYDLPIHASYTHGYYDDAIEFFRNFFSGGFKDNPHLFKGVLTGIMRVAKESIFSGLNNLAVYSLLSREYADSFGFTEAEVGGLARLAEAESHLDTLRAWYNGYVFGRQVMYNPWSVLKFLGDPDKAPRAHWVDTSSDEVLRSLLTGGRLGTVSEQEALLRGDPVEKEIIEPIALRDADVTDEAVWSFLLFSGYLTATDVAYGEAGISAHLRIPNREVRSFYTRLIRGWLRRRLGGDARVELLCEALLAGDGERVERDLEALLLDHVSHHDVPRPSGELPYHMFVLGLLVRLAPDFEVRSNRESGHGRADVLVIPCQPGRPGVVIELKRLDPERDESPEAALDAALAQIDRRDYAAALRARGATPIHAYAAVFDRKRAHVRVRSEPPPGAPEPR